MKKVVLFLACLLILSSSLLNAFQLDFGKGTDYAGTFRPFIFNVSSLNYYDNGTSVYYQLPMLYFVVDVDSENFNPNNAYVYVIVNEEKKIQLEYYHYNSNVPPIYINVYSFGGKIFPQMFGYDYNYDGYTKMLGDIKDITFVIEYKGQKYSYTYSNFSEKYKEFLLSYNNSIKSLDTSNYPQVSWTIDGNIDGVGVCLLEGNDEDGIWDNQTLLAYKKIDQDSKAYYGNWFIGSNIPNSLDFSQEQGIMIPGDDYLILKVKSKITADKNIDDEGYSVMRFQVAFKKIPEDKLIPITNLNGWQLLGGGDEEIFVDDFSKIFDLTKVNTIWSWNNNSWSIWSPDQIIMNVIKDYGLEPIHLIYPFHGFWVNFK